MRLRPPRPRLHAILVLLILAVALGSPASGAPPPTQRAPVAPSTPAAKMAEGGPATLPSGGRTLRVAYSSVTAAYLPFYVAAEQDLFARHGLHVHISQLSNGSMVAAALLGRSLDIALLGSELIPAIAQGQPFVYVMGLSNRLVFSLFARSGLIRTAADLRDRSVGITAAGSSSDAAARLALARFGLEAGQDYRLVNLHSIPAILAGIQQGSVDAGILSAPTTARAVQAGLHEVVDIGALDIPYPHTAVAVSRPFLAQHRDEVVRFAKAVIEGTRRMRSDPQAALSALGEFTKIHDPALLQDAYRRFAPWFSTNPLIPDAALQAALRFNHIQKPRSDFVDDGVVRAAVKADPGSGTPAAGGR